VSLAAEFGLCVVSPKLKGALFPYARQVIARPGPPPQSLPSLFFSLFNKPPSLDGGSRCTQPEYSTQGPTGFISIGTRQSSV
jgi:hypothetical protein